MNLPTLLNGAVQVVSVPSTPQLRIYTRELACRAEQVQLRLVSPEQDNFLKITSDGRKASLFNNEPDSWPAVPDATKLAPLADRVFRHYVETDEEAGAQLVFCDLYTPHEGDDPEIAYLNQLETDADRFTRLGVYGKLKETLIAKGVPPCDVAFAHDHRTPKKRAALHAAIRRGEVRVCVGSTALIGLAVNVQDRIAALHNLDCPWRPSDLEQRTRRGVRQGNRYGEVAVYVYVTEGSYDPVVWQIVEGKARWMAQLLSGTASRRGADDLGAVVLTAGMAKAIALGDGRYLEKMRLEAELGSLERRFLSWRQGRRATARSIPMLETEMRTGREEAERLAQWAERVTHDPLLLDGERPATIQDADSMLRALWQRAPLATLRVGTWRGFTLYLERMSGALVLSAYPSGTAPDGTGIRVDGVYSHRPASALSTALSVESLSSLSRERAREADRLSARVAAARRDIVESWGARDEAVRLLGEYAVVCSAREATDAMPALDSLPDRIGFSFDL